MSDFASNFFWEEVSGVHDRTQHTAALTHAKVAAAQFWPFLAGAESQEDFDNRLSLVSNKIESSVGAALYDEVCSSLRDDYRTLREASLTKEAEGRCSCDKSFTGKGDKDDTCSCGHLNDSHGSDGCHGMVKSTSGSLTKQAAKCMLCGEKFDSIAEVRRHEQTDHANMTKQQRDRYADRYEASKQASSYWGDAQSDPFEAYGDFNDRHVGRESILTATLSAPTSAPVRIRLIISYTMSERASGYVAPPREWRYPVTRLPDRDSPDVPGCEAGHQLQA
jgi:hypothetical protein